MIYIRTAVLAAVASVSLAVAAHAQKGLNDLQIAHSAYTADVIDIEYAKIALGKTHDPQVRDFAELMVRDHTAVNEGATALLTKLKVQPEDNAFSQALVSGATAKKAELNGLSGVAFDRAYAANELAYHQIVNKTVADWIPTIQNADLKAFMTHALVTFRVHEDHANHMVTELKTASN
jgi:putative membrane protein